MHREQKRRAHPWAWVSGADVSGAGVCGALAWLWLPLFLTLAVGYAIPASQYAARAAEEQTETADETTADETDEVAAASDDKAEDQTEDAEAGKEKEAADKDDKQAESAKEKPAEDKAAGDEEGTEEDAQEKSKEMKPPENSTGPTAAPEGGKSPAVEADPAIEVDPPKDDKENGSKKSVPPKKPEPAKKKKCVIGATATLLEKQSELLFSARVDSGAKSCSMHIEKMEIEGEAEKMVDNIGKVIRFQVKNGDKKTHWLESKIAGYVIIKTSDNKERRYKVPLTFRWKNLEKEVLVTLNNRNHMEYPLLLGRNFLRGDFLIDVEIDSDD